MAQAKNNDGKNHGDLVNILSLKIIENFGQSNKMRIERIIHHTFCLLSIIKSLKIMII